MQSWSALGTLVVEPGRRIVDRRIEERRLMAEVSSALGYPSPKVRRKVATLESAHDWGFQTVVLRVLFMLTSTGSAHSERSGGYRRLKSGGGGEGGRFVMFLSASGD